MNIYSYRRLAVLVTIALIVATLTVDQVAAWGGEVAAGGEGVLLGIVCLLGAVRWRS